MTDERILRQMKARNQDALPLLMDKYRRYVMTIAANILGKIGSSSDVDEITQDTFYAVWTHAQSIQSGKLKAYLTITARNKAKSFLRTRRELPMDLDTIDLPDSGVSMEDAVIQAELKEKVQKAISRMRPKDREIFLRYYYYLQSTEEISTILHMTPSTVRSRLSRGRKLLKQSLSKEVNP